MKVITIQFCVDISCSQFVLALQEMKLCMQFVIDEVSKEHPGLCVAAALKRVDETALKCLGYFYD